MKRILFALLLLPAVSNGQLLEVSLKGGVAPGRLYAPSYHQKLPFGGSFSATIGLPHNIRVGTSVSMYRVSYEWIADNPGTGPYNSEQIVNGQPFMPIELVAFKRMEISRLSLDLGITGGILASSKTKVTYNDETASSVTYKSKKLWYTYGLTVGGQIKLTNRYSIGTEIQPKIVDIGRKGQFMMPALVKVSVGI